MWKLTSEQVESTKNENVWVEPRIDVQTKLTAEELLIVEKQIGRYVNLPQAAE